MNAGVHVEDFLITDKNQTQRLAPDDQSNALERLFVSNDNSQDDISIALYLDKQLLEHLESDNPNVALHDGNLSSYCQVLEGISHFVYLIWNVDRQRSVTQLELELQAEVDKYIAAAVLLLKQNHRNELQHLHNVLFEDISFNATLQPEILNRYHEANRYAAKYCHQLAHQYLLSGHFSNLTNEIRHFYRLSHHDKLNYINSL